MRRWIINLIKEAIDEQKLNKETKVLANRDPDYRDYSYHIGTKWTNGTNQYVLTRIEAKWTPILGEENES